MSRTTIARHVLATTLAALSMGAFAQAVELTEGDVRKVDMENRRLTLRHGPLANLDMPGMTMVFLVQDDAMLQRVKAGDKVRFAAEKVDGKFVVIRLERAE